MSCADGTAAEDAGEAPGSGLASICVSNLALKSGQSESNVTYSLRPRRIVGT